MSIMYITAIRVEDPTRCDTITEVMWSTTSAPPERGRASVEEVVEWLADEANRAFVFMDGEVGPEVFPVDDTYIRSSPNDTEDDNLLKLPKY